MVWRVNLIFAPMLIKTRGIVFRAMKYRDTSMIVDIYTEERGLRSYLLNGIRSPKAKIKASLLQVMTLVDMVAYDRKPKGLNRVKELRSAYVYQRVPFELPRSAVGLYMAELARKAIREPEQQPRLFGYLFSAFQLLDTTEHSVSNFPLCFTLGLSAYLGFLPHESWSEARPIFDMQEGVFVPATTDAPYKLTATMSRQLSNLLKLRLENCHTLSLDRQERKALLDGLLTFYRLQVENMPEMNAHLVLEEVFN